MTPEHLAATGLLYDVTGPVATITLNRPEVRNAQTPAMWRALAELGEQIPDEGRVGVVRGAGHSFSAGPGRAMLDPPTPGEESLVGLLGLDDQQLADTIEGFQRGFTFLRDRRFVSVAAVQGYAIGAGFQLALACDLRVMAEDAQLSMKEAALGLVPDLTGTKPLVDSVGYARALEICATARQVSAHEAADLGIATAVVPGAELQAATADLVQALLANNAGAVRETTALLQSARVEDLESQRLLERTAQARRFRALATGG